MSNFKPCTQTVFDEYRNRKQIQKPTYAELKKEIPNIFEEYKDEHGYKLSELHIFRSRRGEWGEWFEIWKPHYIYVKSKRAYVTKYKIEKEGWQ